MPVIRKGSYKGVYVCFVKSPSEFYCYKISEERRLQQLMDNLSKMYKNIGEHEMKLRIIKPGLPCCATYEGDGKWYRGEITEYRENSNTCLVYFVDYGNTETVPLSKVKKLHQDFFELTLQALRCCLYNIVCDGSTWSSDAIAAFSEMASDKTFVAEFVKTDSNGTYLVNLLEIKKLTDNIVNEEFIKLGHGRLSDSNELSVLNSLAALTILDFFELNISVGKPFDINILSISPTLQFCCQFQSDTLEFNQMMESIQQHYSQEAFDTGIIDWPTPGMICIAYFSGNSSWYRARILHIEMQLIEVYYVDYGHTEIVLKNHVKYILQEFTTLPVQAIKFFLRNIKPRTRKTQNCAFQDLLEGQLRCTFISRESDFYYADLTCNDKNVADELIRLKLASSTGPVLTEIQTPALIIPACSLSFKTGCICNVTVSYVESPEEFWCQKKEDALQLEGLMESISEKYTESAESDLHLRPGNFCIAKYCADGVWYRALVNNYSLNGQVEVLFVDYGNSEVIAKSEVRTILPQFVQLPMQAFKCQLYGLPSSYDENSVEIFTEILEEAIELMAEIVKVEHKTVTMTLFDISNSEYKIDVLEAAFNVSATPKENRGRKADYRILPSQHYLTITIYNTRITLSIILYNHSSILILFIVNKILYLRKQN